MPDLLFTPHWIDITPVLSSPDRPVFALSRELMYGTDPSQGLFGEARTAYSGRFWVADGPLNPHYAPSWSLQESSKEVFVPIYAYQTPINSPAYVVGLAIELGFRACSQMRAFTPELPEHVHLVVGQDVLNTSQNDAFIFHFGIAINIGVKKT